MLVFTRSGKCLVIFITHNKPLQNRLLTFLIAIHDLFQLDSSPWYDILSLLSLWISSFLYQSVHKPQYVMHIESMNRGWQEKQLYMLRFTRAIGALICKTASWIALSFDMSPLLRETLRAEILYATSWKAMDPPKNIYKKLKEDELYLWSHTTFFNYTLLVSSESAHSNVPNGSATEVGILIHDGTLSRRNLMLHDFEPT